MARAVAGPAVVSHELTVALVPCLPPIALEPFHHDAAVFVPHTHPIALATRLE